MFKHLVALVEIALVLGPGQYLASKAGSSKVHILHASLALLLCMQNSAGVLTLAFSGFPPSFKKLKEEINENLAAAIPKESPGSMWPKVKAHLDAQRDSTMCSFYFPCASPVPVYLVPPLLLIWLIDDSWRSEGSRATDP
eukprot:1158025-Pelagomonas_calceolata.AAC.2